MEIPIKIKEFNIFILLNVKESDIVAFLVYLNFNKDNNPYTRQRKLSAIRRFYKWLLTTNPTVEIENPTKKITNIQKVIRLPKYLSLNDAKRIQTIFTIKNSKNHIRNNAIISLFLNSGMRVGELINVKIQDINFNNNSIKIHGKGNKERIVYFSDSCKEKLIGYLKLRSRENKVIEINSPLFISYRNNTGLGIYGIEKICKKAYKLMGLEDRHYTTHTLRHTAASLMYIYVSQDILLLKKFLGHASITSTEIYTHIYNKELKEVVEKNPLNDLKISEKKVA